MKYLRKLAKPFQRDYVNYDGVRRIKIYLLRLLFGLMFVFVAYGSWSYILGHTGPWDHVKAAAWCMWAAYSLISFIGIFKPLKMLPIVLFEIIYKITWLLVIAYPMYVKNELTGSAAEGMTKDFLWVVLPIIAMPWKYFFTTYLTKSKQR